MKVIVSLLIIGLICWSLELKFSEIPKLEGQIESLQNDVIENKKSNKIYKDQLLTQQQKIKEISDEKEEAVAQSNSKVEVPQEASSPEPIDNSGKINELNIVKKQAKDNIELKIAEIDSMLKKGNTVLREHLRGPQGFDESNIKKSEADLNKEKDARKQREDYLKTEIGKLETQKITLQREYNSLEAQIDLEIIKLNK
jgi:hypothetical protein